MTRNSSRWRIMALISDKIIPFTDWPKISLALQRWELGQPGSWGEIYRQHILQSSLSRLDVYAVKSPKSVFWTYEKSGALDDEFSIIRSRSDFLLESKYWNCKWLPSEVKYYEHQRINFRTGHVIPSAAYNVVFWTNVLKKKSLACRAHLICITWPQLRISPV